MYLIDGCFTPRITCSRKASSVFMVVCSQISRAILVLGLLAGFSALRFPIGVMGVARAETDSLGPAHHVITHQKFREGRWQLAISANTFSGGAACQLATKDGNTLYRMDAVGFRFPKGWVVSNAVYKIDGSAARRSRDDLPELIARNAPVDRGPPAHAAQGIVWIPYESLQTAKAVTIQPRPDKAPRVRTLDGLAKLHDLAIEHGCSPERSFVE